MANDSMRMFGAGMAVYFGVFLLFSGTTILPTIINRIMGVTYFDYNTNGWANTFTSNANTTWTNAASGIGLPLSVTLIVFMLVFIAIALVLISVGYRQLKGGTKQ